MDEQELLGLDFNQLLGLYMQMTQPQATTDRYGNPEPYDLDTQNKQGTLLKKIDDLAGSPMFSGAAGAYSPQAFAPTETVEEFQGTDPLAPYLMLDPTSIEGYVAQQVATGVAPSQIVAALREEGASPEDVELAQSMAPDLFQSAAQYQQEIQQWGNFDEEGRPAPKVTTEQSDAARQFSDQGFSLPTERFTPDDLTAGEFSRTEDARLMALQAFQSENAARDEEIRASREALDGELRSQSYEGRGRQMMAEGAGGDSGRGGFADSDLGRFVGGGGDAVRDAANWANRLGTGRDLLPDLQGSFVPSPQRPEQGRPSTTPGRGGPDRSLRLSELSNRSRNAQAAPRANGGALVKANQDAAYQAQYARRAMQGAEANGDTPFRRQMMARQIALGMRGL